MNLTYLNLYHNSLLENESVDKLISWGLSSILELNVGLTSLSATNLLRILNATNTQELTNLTISTMPFTQDITHLLPNSISSSPNTLSLS